MQKVHQHYDTFSQFLDYDLILYRYHRYSAYVLLVGVMLCKKVQDSVVSNRIGMKFAGLVFID